jgi:hypothetical protein
MGEERNAYRIVVGNPGGKRPLGVPRHRWIIQDVSKRVLQRW